ncbi:MAG: indolepyruvate ferredoxin oxidoreductase subunit alpha [Lachnospiraceae bacterium]
MSIVIRKEQCTGCGQCMKVCPGSLIKADADHKAYIRYPKNCWGCVSCIKECRFDAMSFYLGADIGGRGSLLSIEKQGDYMDWRIDEPGRPRQTIRVNSKDSNQY